MISLVNNLSIYPLGYKNFSIACRYKLSLLFALQAFLFIGICQAQEIKKKTLGIEAYDLWQSIVASGISDYSATVFYEQNAEKRDGQLFVVQSNGKRDTIDRGYKAVLSYRDSMLVFMVKPQYDSIRALKLKKIKEDKLPKDSLGIFLLKSDSLIKIERVKNFKLAEDSSNWIGYQLEKPVEKDKGKSKEPEKSKKKNKKKKNDKNKKPKIKEEGTELFVSHPLSGYSKSLGKVNEYTCSKYGDIFGAIRNWKSDTIDSTAVVLFSTKSKELFRILETQGTSKSLCFDEQGTQCAFLFSGDTAKNDKVFRLYHWSYPQVIARNVVDSQTVGMPKGWCVSEFSGLKFSRNGKRLFLGTNVIPVKIPKDTLLEDEKVHVDVWSYNDDKLQTQQLFELKKEKKRNYTAVYHIGERRFVQIGTETIETIRLADHGNADFAFGVSTRPYDKESSWQYPTGVDIYSVDLISGKSALGAKGVTNRYTLSPYGNFAVWYNAADRTWKSYDVKRSSVQIISAGANVRFENERHDIPSEAQAYSVAGWADNDKYVYIYDRFDIWKMDPGGGVKAQRLTLGREQQTEYRVLDLDKENVFWKDSVQLLKVFNQTSKQSGYASINIYTEKPVELYFLEDTYVSTPARSKHGGKLLWSKRDYQNYPDLLLSGSDFKNSVRVSNVNPQKSDYYWGTVELVKWTSEKGRSLEGLLYKPDDFSVDKSYPMIVYFYERYSDLLHFHFAPRPSRSTISFPYYASNGYVVFVPDIEYGTGHPGQDANDAIVSGTKHILQLNKNIDSKRLGIQGQSWGGYQTAILITQTDLFSAAMAGAPVSNMTSAYGGIRWGSGRSRMFQYENAQSRIGYPLWERTDLYIENSPLFFAPNIKTPLLIMHNDNDGAVPWYQGIELFVAMRRLNKPVWLLNYNKEEHNLTKWPNRVDLSIRMKQFFDHYLLSAPMPEWMHKGIPAVEKGKGNGYGLID